MKNRIKLFSVLLIALVSTNVHAQWVNSGTTEYNLGNVGIGTSSPAYNLDVNGTLGISGIARFRQTVNMFNLNHTNKRLTFNQSSTNHPRIYNYDEVAYTFHGITIGGTNSDSDGMHINGIGNVGIGTASPLRELDVSGDIELSGNIYGKNTDHTYIQVANSSYHHRFYTRTDIGASTERFRIEGGGVIDDVLVLNSNFNVNSGQLYAAQSNGNVGIGTSSPTNKLTVLPNARGDAGFSINDPNYSSLSRVELSTNTSGDGSMELKRGNNTTTAFLSASGESYLTGGNVGIGTTTPYSKMHISAGSVVNSAHNFADLVVEDDNHAMIVISTASTSNGYYGFADENDDYVAGMQYHHGSNNLHFRVNNHDTGDADLTIQNDGNVGIGTVNPFHKFHLQDESGNLSLNLKLDKTSTTNDYAEIAFQLWSGATSGNNDFGGTGTSRPSVVLRALNEDGNQAAGAFVVGTFTGGPNNSTLTEKFRITSGGNVGIGTTNPDQKLTVAGVAKAREIIVEETAGADFVFEDDYDLPTLTNIEQFIRANKHLEGIPSAKEMIENGVKVGELQIKLLQKIEELTLYAIAQEKLANARLELLKEERSVNNKQQELIEQLLKRMEKVEKERK